MTQPGLQPDPESPELGDRPQPDVEGYDGGGDIGPAGEANDPTATPPGDARSSGDLGALRRGPGDGSAAETP